MTPRVIYFVILFHDGDVSEIVDGDVYRNAGAEVYELTPAARE